jgi:hypothetical protein
MLMIGMLDIRRNLLAKEILPSRQASSDNYCMAYLLRIYLRRDHRYKRGGVTNHINVTKAPLQNSLRSPNNVTTNITFDQSDDNPNRDVIIFQ